MINLGGQLLGAEKFQEQKSQANKNAANSSEKFADVLAKASGERLTAQAVSAIESSNEKVRFNRKKEAIEKGEGRTEKKEEESVYKKIQRVADSLRLIALFEKKRVDGN